MYLGSSAAFQIRLTKDFLCTASPLFKYFWIKEMQNGMASARGLFYNLQSSKGRLDDHPRTMQITDVHVIRRPWHNNTKAVATT